MSLLDDVAVLYVSEGLGTEGTDIFGSTLSIIPKLDSGAVISIIETGGTNPDFFQNNTRKPAYTNPTALVMVTAVDYQTARNKAQAAYDVSTRANETINGKFYQKLRPLNEPGDQKPDGRGNARVSFNILGKRRA